MLTNKKEKLKTGLKIKKRLKKKKGMVLMVSITMKINYTYFLEM